LAWLLGVSSPYLTFVTDEEPSQTAISCQVWASLSACIPLARLGKTSLQKVIIAGYAAPEENKAGGNKETGMSTIALGINLSQLGSIPFMLDEVTNNDADSIATDSQNIIRQG
jgi:hypothetical protein